MHIPKRQTGMTLWGISYVVGTLALFIFFLFKLIPPYLDDLKIKTALESVGRQATTSPMSNHEIQEAMRKRLEIDNLDQFELGKWMVIEQRGRNKRVRINYETVTPLVFNLSFLLSFDHSVEVRGGE